MSNMFPTFIKVEVVGEDDRVGEGLLLRGAEEAERPAQAAARDRQDVVEADRAGMVEPLGGPHRDLA